MRSSLAVSIFLLLCVATPALSAADTKALAGTYHDPVDLEPLPDGSLLIAQREGTIVRVLPESADPTPQAWADLTDSTAAGPDTGLLGLAADPGFAANGYVYALQSYIHQGESLLRVVRLRDGGNGAILNRILIEGIPSGSVHPGGALAVGPDGNLYVGNGDGGVEAAQLTPSSQRAALLRYRLDGSIPADNPDPKSPVWAWGLRDLRGLAWHPTTGRLYALDRGPVIPKGTMDELNLIAPGKNYGWPKYLGRDKDHPGYENAVIYCSSGHSWVPGGALFVRGGDWNGSLLFAGAGEGVLYHLTFDPNKPTKTTFYEELIGGALGALIDVTQSIDGQLYLLSRTTLYTLSQD